MAAGSTDANMRRHSADTAAYGCLRCALGATAALLSGLILGAVAGARCARADGDAEAPGAARRASGALGRCFVHWRYTVRSLI